MKKQLLTKKEVAESLSVDIQVVDELIDEKKLNAIELRPGVTRIKRASVFHYLNSIDGGIALSRLFLILWITAVCAFCLQLFIIAKYFDHTSVAPNWVLGLLLGNIGLGIIFFLGIFLVGDRRITKVKWLPKGFVTWSIYLIYLLLMVTPVLAKANVTLNKNEAPQPVVAPVMATPTPTSSSQSKQATKAQTNTSTKSQTECIGPDGKNFWTSMDECKKLNEKWGKSVDYMTDCNIHPDCGGGTVRMSYIQCMKPCSGITNAKSVPSTVVVTSAPSANKTPVFLSYGGYTVYCPSQNVGAVMSINSTMESKKTVWAKNYNDCTDLYFKTNSCILSCKSTNESDLNSCTSTYGYSGDGYSTCNNQAWDNYSACIAKCSPNSAESCQYVYAESKSLSDQISNLCK